MKKAAVAFQPASGAETSPEELLPIIAHELNASLQGLLAQLQLLQRELENQPALQQRVELIRQNARRHGETISSLSAFSQRVPHLQMCSAESVAAQLLPLLRALAISQRVTLQGSFPRLPQVEVDANWLRQILLNLLNNAIAACSGGGTVTLKSTLHDDRPALIVADDGGGVSEATLPHMFTPHFTTKPDGHGLGLAHSRRLAQLMGGDLILENHEGEGCEFILLLPQ